MKKFFLTILALLLLTASAYADLFGGIFPGTTNQAIGYNTYSYTAGSGAAYSVSGGDTCPAAYQITGGSGTTDFIMSYTGSAESNKGKLFYIVNSSSNTVTFKQSGATGVSIATLKIVTVLGNGTDFQRITADQ